MIFAISTFKETNSRLQSHCCPFGHSIQLSLIGYMCNSIINILQYLFYNKYSGITWFCQIGIIRGHCLLMPGHIPETLYFFKIEISSKKTGNAIIPFPYGRIRTTMGMRQVEIDVTQISPIPSTSGSRNGTRPYHRFRKSEYAHYIFTFTITGRSSRKQSIKIIRCTPQFLFIIIIGLWR